MKTTFLIISFLSITTIYFTWSITEQTTQETTAENDVSSVQSSAIKYNPLKQNSVTNTDPTTGLIIPKTFVKGLDSPIGIIPGWKGGFFVAEAGTGINDGKVTYLSKTGNRHTVIEGLPSGHRIDGNIEGTTHIALDQNKLWILNGVSGMLYNCDLTNFNLDQLPIQANTLQTQDIKSFVLNYNFKNDTEESNIYNLVFDEDHNMYIVDSGANAIIKRTLDGTLSVLSEIPNIPNPQPKGEEPTIEAVPSGIIYNGKHLLVATFTGHPFPEGAARIYSIDLTGKIIGFRDGFTGLIDLAQSPEDQSLFVLELGNFGGFGINFNSGNFIMAGEDSSLPLVQGLNYPNGIAFYNNDQVLVTNYLDGTISHFSIR